MVTRVERAETCAAPRFDVYSSLAEARDDWLALFDCAPASPYQNYDYVSSWCETVGTSQGLEPMIIVARDGDGAPLALIPLGTYEAFGLRMAEFLCGRESNFNLPLLRPGVSLNLHQLLLAAARDHARSPDLLYLRNQPRRFDDAENPLAAASASASPSFAYGSTLPAEIDTLDLRDSGDTRRKLRRKLQRLAAQGALMFEHNAKGARASEIVNALIAQKSSRLRMMGVEGAFHAEAIRAFLDRLTDAGVAEAHALSLSGRIIATYVGLPHSGRFSAMMNSFDMDSPIARCSPGDLLLRAVLRNLVTRGFTRFDLGVGEARYKSAVCEETIELFDSLIPATTRGASAAPLLRAFLSAKRLAKNTPWLARIVELGRQRKGVARAR
jgi:CelD/BcsL family acetyltransferase involved in cellulose biosynthesis